MNKIYKIVWNKALGQMVVVSEHAKSAAKGTTVGTHLSRPLHKTQNVSACPQWLLCSLSLSMALVANATWAGVANTALPTGANITQGSAQISQNNNSLNITQNSQNLSTNWNSFNIGKDATVNFNQPNQSAIAVNRVLDNNASQIMGKLNANGQVFLLNPNGVIFSKTAQVNVGGLVASTLNLSDSDIAQGKFTLKNSFENQGNAGSVENYGSIIANGGVVALIAPTVKNHGTIQAHNGTVHLTAADQVTLQLQDGSLVEYQIDLGTLQGLVENGGAIQADNGAVYLTAQAKNSLSKAVVNHTGIIEANRLSKNAKGEIILLGDMQHGTTTVSGTLKAEGKNGQDGGFIETSAANVQIQDSTKVSTLSDSGKTGEWLIDPFNVTISNQAQAGNNNVANTFTPSQNDSIINVGTLNSALASNNITVTTAGAGTQAGNINVNADVTWNANTALTLRADNDIHINANITATDNTGKLNLQYGQDPANSSTNYYLNNGAKVNLKAGQNFSTQKGANAPINYTVITDLGAAGSTTSQDLQGMSGGLTDNYVLGADIDATATSGWNNGQGFNPIGNSSNRFTGKFDGLNHTISNLTINRPNQDYVGLFGATNNATIQNIGLIQANIKGSWRVGALIGEANSTNTSNAFSTGQVNGDVAVGGLVGINQNQSNILSSYSNAQVTATNNFVGGLSGENLYRSRIENSYATGAVQAQGSYAGGLSGNNFDNSVIKNSYATGAVSGIDAVGGLLGNNYSSTVENSYATGQVTRTSGNAMTFGGLVGRVGGTIKNSYYDKTSTGQANAVGDGTGTVNAADITIANRYSRNGYSNLGTWSLLAGTTNVYVAKDASNQNQWVMIEGQTRPFLWSEYSTNINNLHQLQLMAVDLTKNYTVHHNIDATATNGVNTSDMWSTAGFDPIGNSSNTFTGKFDGLNHTISNLNINRAVQNDVGLFGATNNATIQNIGLIQANIKGSLGVGALIGLAEYTNTSNAFSTGQVNGDVAVGGLVGINHNQSNILSSYSNAQVTVTDSFAGGLSGINEFSSRIESSYATGAVQAQGSYAGGLSGNNIVNSVIKNSYATGAVSGMERVGGLLGNNFSSTVENSYATGQVSISTGTQQGGLVGWTGGTINNSYWNKDTTGQTQAVGDNSGNLTSVVGLTTAQMFDKANFAGFDFNSIWNNADNQTTPYFKNHVGLNSVFNKNDSTNALYNVIQNIHHLQGVNNNLGGKYVLGNHIEAVDTVNWNAGQGFDPIGDSSNHFTGKFDGLGYTVNDLYINRLDTGNVGLFARIRNATVQNIGLNRATVTGKNVVGSLIGEMNNSTLQNSYSSDANVTGEQAVGGLVGSSYTSTIAQSYSTGMVKGRAQTGGLVGTNSQQSTIKESYSAADVDGNGVVLTGGLAGHNNDSNISQSYATGNVVGVGGALVGVNENNAQITQSYWSTGISGAAEGIYITQSGGSTDSDSKDLTAEQMKNGASFVGFDIDGQGGTGKVWRIYEGNTAPLLRSFLTQATLGTVANQSTTYNGQTQGVDLSGVSLAGLDSSKIFAGQSSSKNVGAYNNVGYYSNQQGYDFIGGNASLTINKADLTLAGLSAGNKVYDATTVATLTGTASVSPLGSDSVTLGGTGIANFADKNVGNNKTVTVSGYTLSGADAGNYNLVQPTGLKANISKADLALAGLSAADKIYDATTTATLSGTAAVTALGSDAVSVGGTGAGTFADKNVGTNKAVTVTGYTLSGTDAGNYNLVQPTGLTATISQRTLNATLTAQNKIYDGNNSASVSYGDDRIGQDVLVVSGTATFNDKNAATGKTVTANNLALTGTDAGNYELASTTATTQADIDKATLTATITAQNKIYDGNNSASVSYGDDRIGQDVLVVSGTATFSDKNAATGKTVTANNLALTGTDAGNYELASTTATTQADIDKATLTATITAQNKIYDGNNSASVSYGDDRIGQDVLVVSGTATFNDKNAATGKTVTANNLALTGTDAGNYELASTTATTQADIDKATLTATITAQNKIYDGNNSASVSYGDDRIGQDVLVVSGTATFNDKNAATGKTVTANNLALTGTDAGNYELASTTATTQADIDKATLTATLNAQNKIYDGNNSASVSYGDDRIGQDVLVVSGTATFSDKNAATGKTVTANNLALTGTDAGNYELASTTATTQADIDKATLTATITAQNKIYDGNNSASVSYGDDRIGQDVLVVSGTATFNDKNAATGKTVTANNLALTGTDAGNYELASTTATTQADIDKATLTATITAQNKIYDGNNSASVSYGDDRIGQDVLVVSGTATFNDKNAATGKTVTANNLALTGTDAGNYELASTTATTQADIDKATLTATLNAQNKIYDGNNSASVSYGDDRIGQDVLVVSGTATFSDKNAGNGKTVTANNLALTGTDAGNYELASTTATTQADIDKATLTATITAQNKIYDGNNSASVSYGDDRIGQDVLVVSGTATFNDKNAATGKTVTANNLALTGTDAGNYELASTTATTQADIDKATLTATITAQNKIYDGNTSASVSYGDDRIGQDVLVVSGTATFNDKNAATGKTVTANNLALTGTDAGNYVLAATTATDTADISKAQAIVTANSLNTVYNGQNQTASGFSATGLVNGEDSSVLTGVTASVTAKDAGSYTNKANGVDKNYDLTFVDGALEIAKAKATVTANSLNTVYNGQNQTVTGFSATGLVGGEDESVLTGVSTTGGQGKNAGSYSHTASGTDSNYDITFVDGALEIAKAKATVTANSLNTVYNGQNQTVTGFSATGLVGGEDESVLTGVSTTGGQGKNAGSYSHTASGTDSNYDITFVDGALEIAKAKATVTANSLNTVYNGQNQTVTGFSATGLVGGEDESVLTGISTTGGQGKNAGSYSHTASGTDSNYDITFVDGALEIAKAKATVTANSLNTVYNGQNQTVTGFSASGLVAGEDEAVLSNVSASVTAQEVGNYANKITGSDDNYELTFVDGVLSIQAKPIVPIPPQPPVVPQLPVVPSYYPIWGNPYQRAIRTQPVQQKPKAFDIVEIEIEGHGINMDNIQTLGSN